MPYLFFPSSAILEKIVSGFSISRGKEIAITSLLSVFCLIGSGRATGQDLVVVKDGAALTPIVVAADAPPATAAAVEELAQYLEKISGVRPPVLTGNPVPVPEHAIWVGPHPLLGPLVPGLDLDFSHPEEILISADGQHLVIAGRDRMAGGTQTEHGTANAVYTFLQNQLGVRRFWPGPLGEDVIQRETIAIPTMAFRYHPQFRQRKLWPEQPPDWYLFQRCNLFSLRVQVGHAFMDWWEKYHPEHPDYFALQPDGSRDAFPDAKHVKIAVTNPKVWEQWLDDAEAGLRQDPARIMASASPNDGSVLGECVSLEAMAWDHPDGEKVTLHGKGGAIEHVALTERYVKFWNILAQGLKERFPERKMYLGAMAYGPYKYPPLDGVLEDNVVIGYVAHFPLAGDDVTEKEKAEWLGWKAKARQMVFRPNLFHYSGGWLGLPTVALDRTVDAFRFLAENNCIGIEVDTLPRSWATQGVQFYLMAHLAYDPLQDAAKLLDDYYSRAFGPAASEVQEYFQIMEQAHEAVLARVPHSSGFARTAIETVYPEVYNAEVLKKATEAMDRAARKAAGHGEVFPQRVDFIRTGLDFTRTQIEIMKVMTKVRESGGTDGEAVHRALALSNERDRLAAKYPYAVVHAEWYHDVHKLDDFMGPPDEQFQKAAAGLEVEKKAGDSERNKSAQELFPEGGWD